MKLKVLVASFSFTFSSLQAQITTSEVKVEDTAGATFTSGGFGIGFNQPTHASLQISESFGGFDRLTQIYPTGNAKPGLNLMASTDAAGTHQWWVWGVDNNTWKIQPGYGFVGTNGLFVNENGNLGIGVTGPTASLDIARGDSPGGTAIFRGTDRWSHFNFSTGEHTYIRGGKPNSFVLLNDNGGNVGIGLDSPSATLQVTRGNGSGGTAIFQGTHRWSHFNYSDGEHTYIRGGKSNSHVLINDYGGGNVGIGTDGPTAKLHVNGDIRSGQNHWADFVFEESYDLPTLEEVEEHIKEKGHLSEIPSEKEVVENGYILGNMDAKFLQKIEELTLYLIEQNKEIQALKAKNQELERRLERVEP